MAAKKDDACAPANGYSHSVCVLPRRRLCFHITFLLPGASTFCAAACYQCEGQGEIPGKR